MLAPSRRRGCRWLNGGRVNRAVETLIVRAARDVNGVVPHRGAQQIRRIRQRIRRLPRAQTAIRIGFRVIDRAAHHLARLGAVTVTADNIHKTIWPPRWHDQVSPRAGRWSLSRRRLFRLLPIGRRKHWCHPPGRAYCWSRRFGKGNRSNKRGHDRCNCPVGQGSRLRPIAWRPRLSAIHATAKAAKSHNWGHIRTHLVQNHYRTRKPAGNKSQLSPRYLN